MRPSADPHAAPDPSPASARLGLLVSLLVGLLAACSPLRPPPGPATATAIPVPPAASAVASAAPMPAPPAPAPAPPPAPPRPDPSDLVARQLLAASERMRGLGYAELVREVVRLSEGPPSPAATLEMALGLGLTRNNGDLARAIGILDPIARSSSPDLALWQPWARLLLSRYLDQRRAEEQAERQAQQLRDQQRRIDQLNNQVEALKAIERSMAPRPTPPATGGAGAPPARPP